MSPRDADCSLVSTPFNKHWSHLCAAGILSPAARDALAEELTDVALECEKLPTTPFVKSTIWVYFNELPSDRIYHGGKPGGTKVISLEVNPFKGGHDETSKQLLFERFTQAICKYAEIR